MKFHRTLGMGLLLGGALLSVDAIAQNAVVPPAPSMTGFGQAGQFVLGAERLFGLTWSNTSVEDGGVTSSVRWTTFSLVTDPTGRNTTNYSSPRVGADYFVTNGLSLGAALGFMVGSGSVKLSGNGYDETSDIGTATGFLVAPRVGYAIVFSDTLGIWPRGGITYNHVKMEDDDGSSSVTQAALALTLEAPLVITPFPHLGFSVGPTLDLGLSGSSESDDGAGTTSSTDFKATDIGLQAGMFLYF